MGWEGMVTAWVWIPEDEKDDRIPDGMRHLPRKDYEFGGSIIHCGGSILLSGTHLTK